MVHHVIHAALYVAGFFTVTGIVIGALGAKVTGTIRRKHRGA